jgi:hypothetical protein
MNAGFWWETKGKRPHERTRFRENNIKVGLNKMGQCGLDVPDSG